MNDEQRKWFRVAIEQINGTISLQPEFLHNEELKALYVVLHAAIASLEFHKTESLAKTCSAWCYSEADKSEDAEGFPRN